MRGLPAAVEHAGDPVPEELARLRPRALARHRACGRWPASRRAATAPRCAARTGHRWPRVVADEVAARTLGPTTTVTRWDEVEVELTGGNPGLLKAANRRLRRGGLRPAAYLRQAGAGDGR